MIAALVGADQAVKYWAVNSLRPKGSIDFIHFGDFKVIDLTYLTALSSAVCRGRNGF